MFGISDLKRPRDEKRVGFKEKYDEITSGEVPAPSDIRSSYIQLSAPWKDLHYE